MPVTSAAVAAKLHEALGGALLLAEIIAGKVPEMKPLIKNGSSSQGEKQLVSAMVIPLRRRTAKPRQCAERATLSVLSVLRTLFFSSGGEVVLQETYALAVLVVLLGGGIL